MKILFQHFHKLLDGMVLSLVLAIHMLATVSQNLNKVLLQPMLNLKLSGGPYSDH